MTVRQLLDHRSGLPAWQALWLGEVGGRAGRAIVEAALDTPPEAPPGARHRYSDIGFLVLMALLEERAGEPLDVLLRVEVIDPAGMAATGFRGVGGGERVALVELERGAIAATERCPERGLLVGEVSDRNTWHMGGVAPHAGLFGPAEDLIRLAQGWWSGDLLGTALRDEAWGPAAEPGTHVLGWDTVSTTGSSAGGKLSRRSHGHLAFTGCSLWVDPDRQVAVALLCNRIHPTREDTRIKDLRPALHDAVADLVDWLG